MKEYKFEKRMSLPQINFDLAMKLTELDFLLGDAGSVKLNRRLQKMVKEVEDLVRMYGFPPHKNSILEERKSYGLLEYTVAGLKCLQDEVAWQVRITRDGKGGSEVAMTFVSKSLLDELFSHSEGEVLKGSINVEAKVPFLCFTFSNPEDYKIYGVGSCVFKGFLRVFGLILPIVLVRGDLVQGDGQRLSRFLSHERLHVLFSLFFDEYLVEDTKLKELKDEILAGVDTALSIVEAVAHIQHKEYNHLFKDLTDKESRQVEESLRALSWFLNRHYKSHNVIVDKKVTRVLIYQLLQAPILDWPRWVKVVSRQWDRQLGSRLSDLSVVTKSIK
jgi:hypothetical protein